MEGNIYQAIYYQLEIGDLSRLVIRNFAKSKNIDGKSKMKDEVFMDRFI